MRRKKGMKRSIVSEWRVKFGGIHYYAIIIVISSLILRISILNTYNHVNSYSHFLYIAITLTR